jgi:hypothetical protein
VLAWSLQHAKHVKHYCQVAVWRAKRGIPIPKALTDRPLLEAHLFPVMRGYQEICTSRSIGMAAGPIPWSELSAWCSDNGIVGANRLRWVRMLRALDMADLKAMRSVKNNDN